MAGEVPRWLCDFWVNDAFPCYSREHPVTAYLLAHDWIIKLAAGFPLLLIVYLSWRSSRRRDPDPTALPPVSAEWRAHNDRRR